MEAHLKNIMLGLLAYAAQRDLPPEKICKQAGISLEDVYKATLSNEQVGQLWLTAIQLSSDPLFGLHFGESLQLSALGIIGEAIKTSATVGEALSLALSILPTVTTAFKAQITQQQDTFTVSFIAAEKDWQQSITSRQTLDLLMVFLIHELDGLLLKKIIPESVGYWQQINDGDEHERVFRCFPAYTPGHNTITFAKCYWAEAIITANYRLQQVLLNDFLNAQNYIAGLPSFRSGVQDYLMNNSYLGISSLEATAANFNLSIRTLQRRLKEEGVTFEILADQVRKTVTLAYLKSRDHELKEIALMLGYNDVSNFTRAFKRWTGMPPATWLSKTP